MEITDVNTTRVNANMVEWDKVKHDKKARKYPPIIPKEKRKENEQNNFNTSNKK